MPYIIYQMTTQYAPFTIFIGGTIIGFILYIITNRKNIPATGMRENAYNMMQCALAIILSWCITALLCIIINTDRFFY